MRKVTLSEPVIIAQSTTEPVLFGGHQDPFIRCSDGKILYARYSARRDDVTCLGLEDKNPVCRSDDGGKSWERVSDPKEWMKASGKLKNGDYLEMLESLPILNVSEDKINSFPDVDVSRKRISAIGEPYDAYTVDELAPMFEGEVTKTFRCKRIYAGSDEIVYETCKVNWKNMPIRFTRDIVRREAPQGYKCDKNGVLWSAVEAPYIDDNGKCPSKRLCTHIIRSDDYGHTWDYVNTLVYKEEYNDPNMKDIEGFSDCTLEFLSDGSMIGIVRSGSLFPLAGEKMGDKDHPAPRIFYFKSSDQGKTFDFIKPFYDYGVFPRSVTLDNGTIIAASGRPGVYIRTCDDPKGEEWNDVIDIIKVPEEDIYDKYWQYSCSNTDICAYDSNTAYLTYSDFKLLTPDGERAKSIVVRKITVE